MYRSAKSKKRAPRGRDPTFSSAGGNREDGSWVITLAKGAQWNQNGDALQAGNDRRQISHRLDLRFLSLSIIARYASRLRKSSIRWAIDNSKAFSFLVPLSLGETRVLLAQEFKLIGFRVGWRCV